MRICRKKRYEFTKAANSDGASRRSADLWQADELAMLSYLNSPPTEPHDREHGIDASARSQKNLLHCVRRTVS
jgi:hypothetical protein